MAARTPLRVRTGSDASSTTSHASPLRPYAQALSVRGERQDIFRKN